jgi:hypothetical protein
MVILPKNLFLRVKNQLNPSFFDDLSFSVIDSELKNIKYLNMYKSDLKYIEYFQGIEMIEISSFPSITNEELESIFKFLPNLKKIVIKEQNALTSIKFKKANSLIDVRIVSNENLVEIRGLENLSRLKSLTLYDNQHLKNKQQFVAFAVANSGKIRYSLDVNYYKDIQLLCFDKNIMFTNSEWVEYVGLRKHTYYAYDKEEITNLAKYINKVVDKYIYKNDSPMEKFVILYKWMIDNVSFVNEDTLFFKNDLGKLCGIANTFRYLKGGRLSYAKAFQFLLSFAGIKSDIVYSLGASDSIGLFNGQEVHSLLGATDYALLKVYIDNKAYYCDIAWDGSVNKSNCYNELHLFLMDKEELLLRHRIVGEVNVINTYSLHGEYEEDLLMYASDRIKSVNKFMNKLDSYKAYLDGASMNIEFLENEIKDLRLENTTEYDDELFSDEDDLKEQKELYDEYLEKRRQLVLEHKNIICSKYLGIENVDKLNIEEKSDLLNFILGLVNYNMYSEDLYNLIIIALDEE